MSSNDESPGEDTGTTHAGDCPAGNEHGGGASRSANDRTSLEDENCGQERPFHGQDAVQLAEWQLEGCGGEKVSVRGSANSCLSNMAKIEK